MNTIDAELLEAFREHRGLEMNMATQTIVVPAKSFATRRLTSIDIFRGLTMVAMIFVNDLASVHGLPWWNYHMKAEVNFMTYVDMVYPFFLFAVGLSMPLAFQQRLKKNASLPILLRHVAVRSASLIVLGLILANAEKGDVSRMGINPNAWALLALIGGVLFLSVYKGSRNYSTLHSTLRIAGLVLTIAMLGIFRRTVNGHAAWIDGSYPEILGLIGYTYFAVSLLYVLTRRWTWAPLGWFVVLLAFNALCVGKWAEAMRHIPLYFWPFGNGAMACITMAGVAASKLFLVDSEEMAFRRKLATALGFAIAVLVAGWFLAPLGISKIRATPTWSLYSIGAALIALTTLIWICDVREHTRWALFVRPAGANTLLTYLLPDFYYFAIALLGVSYFNTHFSVGWEGAMRSVVFTAMILALSAFLTRVQVRLQL